MKFSASSRTLRQRRSCGEAGVGLAGTQGDAFELLELAEEVLVQEAPFVDLGVDAARLGASRMLGDHHLRAASVQVRDDPVDVEGLVGDQPAERDPLDQRRDSDRVEALARQQLEPDKVAERVGQRDDLRGPAAARAAYGLALSPPFEPCPWRWTLTIVPSIMANSRAGSSDTASKMRLKTSSFTQ